MSTDHELMLAVGEGDVDKLGLLFEKHHRHLFNFFVRQTSSHQTSEDLVQDKSLVAASSDSSIYLISSLSRARFIHR